ncbi:MAG: hypothetical protein AAFO82_13670, partial [Bacteroidota bacterium]
FDIPEIEGTILSAKLRMVASVDAYKSSMEIYECEDQFDWSEDNVNSENKPVRIKDAPPLCTYNPAANYISGQTYEFDLSINWVAEDKLTVAIYRTSRKGLSGFGPVGMFTSAFMATDYPELILEIDGTVNDSDDDNDDDNPTDDGDNDDDNNGGDDGNGDDDGGNDDNNDDNDNGDNNTGESVWDIKEDGTVYYNGGNVGIGTDTPITKFVVDGEIRATKVRVRGDVNLPDYVFEEDYDLRSLEEVETYIEQNGHLPEVPSAAQVEKEGLSLGDMDATLLKKVEELTLYLIEMKKQNEELKKEVEVLKKQLKD